jgi:hypothetical protein
MLPVLGRPYHSVWPKKTPAIFFADRAFFAGWVIVSPGLSPEIDGIPEIKRLNYESLDIGKLGRAMKRLRIIPGRWHRSRSVSLGCRLNTPNARWRLIQVLFSSTGGGGPPA